MQYGGYFPQSYQNSYLQQYQQNGFGNQQMPTSTMQAQNPAQMGNFSQQSGFIPVQNENEARMYPIAPGTSATFIDENSPYCYTKTLGASQLDRPTFKKFKLVEETDTPQDAPQGSQTVLQNQGIDLSAYALKADLNVLNGVLEALQSKVDSLMQNQPKRTASKAKKEDEE
jgi:hypothetical protein